MSADAQRYLVAIGLLVMAGAGARFVDAWRVAPARYKVDFASVPLKVGDFQGREVEVDEATRSYLKPDAMVTRVYEGARRVMVSLIYSRDWTQIHNAAGCFPAQGWLILEDAQIDIPLAAPVAEQEVIHGRRLYCRKQGKELVSVFVFAYPGGTTSDWTRYAMKVALGPRGAGGLIIISQTAVEGGKVQRAAADLTRLVAGIYPAAVAFWYR